MLPALVEGLGLVHAKVSVPAVSAKVAAIPVVPAKAAAAVLVAEVAAVTAATAAAPLLELKHEEERIKTQQWKITPSLNLPPGDTHIHSY